jgi:fatty-acyl-CoA synthase
MRSWLSRWTDAPRRSGTGGVCVANHCAQLVLLFALARIGAVLLPLNFRLAPAEWESQMRDCTPAHLVHDDTWAAQAQDLGRRSAVAVHSTNDLAQASASAAPQAADPGAPVLLVYTSGTTGQPRAAVHTQANLLANMRIAARVQELRNDDRVLTVLPLFHVGGLCIQTLPALYAGASVLLHRRFSPDQTLAAIAGERPTLTLQVPPTMKALVEHAAWQRTDLTSLRAVWAGSSLLPAELVRAFLDRGIPLCNVYGATETGPFSIALAPEFAASHAGSCGWPAPEVDVKLVAGELLVRGPNVVRHYWPQQPAVDADEWIHTGDLASCAGDGSYTVIGRARDIIISGGENIDPLEVEAAVAAHAAVAECAAFGTPDPGWGEAVAIAIVLKADGQLDEEALRRHLDGRLARFKQPRRVLFVQALPKTALGKLQRAALATMAAPGDGTASAPA